MTKYSKLELRDLLQEADHIVQRRDLTDDAARDTSNAFEILEELSARLRELLSHY